jgi:hypothetical protein
MSNALGGDVWELLSTMRWLLVVQAAQGLTVMELSYMFSYSVSLLCTRMPHPYSWLASFCQQFIAV